MLKVFRVKEGRKEGEGEREKMKEREVHEMLSKSQTNIELVCVRVLKF